MAIVTVEALVKCQAPNRNTQSALYETGDIITVQPAGHGWGKGDLQGKTVVKMDLDLPYGDKCFETVDGVKRMACTRCEYMGLDWGGKTALTEGDTATMKTDCPLQSISVPDMETTFSLDIHGMPQLTKNVRKKRRAKLDIASVVSKETLDKIKAETECSDAEKDKRLTDARKSTVPTSLVSVK